MRSRFFSCLLFIIGGKMILDSFKNGNEEEVFDVFNLIVVLVLAIATSIDAFAVGLSFSLLHIMPLIPALIIGLISATFSVGGVYSGGKIGHILGKQVDVLGGVILILIGVRILLEHLVWNGTGITTL